MIDLYEFFNQEITPAIQEEFVHPRFKTFDFVYLRKLSDLKITSDKIKEIMSEYIDDPIFKDHLHENEVSCDEFYEHYEFGKYPNVRGWIGYFWENTGKLLTRSKLFDYIQRSSKSNTSRTSFAPL